jgi:hypothetical protein
LISLAHCTTPVYPIDFVVAVCCSCLQNGRIKGDAKKALRGVIEQYGIPVTLSANQNILLRDVEPAWKEDIQARLEVSTQILSHYHMWGLAVMSLFLVPVSHKGDGPQLGLAVTCTVSVALHVLGVLHCIAQ